MGYCPRVSWDFIIGPHISGSTHWIYLISYWVFSRGKRPSPLLISRIWWVNSAKKISKITLKWSFCSFLKRSRPLMITYKNHKTNGFLILCKSSIPRRKIFFLIFDPKFFQSIRLITFSTRNTSRMASLFGFIWCMVT